MKPGPILAMLVILGLSVWVMIATTKTIPPTPGASVFELVVQNDKIKVEQVRTDAGYQYRFLSGPQAGGAPMNIDQFQTELAKANATGRPLPLRLLNVTSYKSLLWVALGLGGQIVFAGRMIVQWIASERQRRSVVPPAFWYMSLGGGLLLTTYFVWRHDLVGVLGQTMGLVVYVRNIRLLWLHRTQTAAAPATVTT